MAEDSLLTSTLEPTNEPYAVAKIALEDNMQLLEMASTWDALDVVLLQQVMAKVRLMVGDPANDSLIQSLEEWSESYGKFLRRCASLINSWSEALKDGRDVIQA